MKMFFATWILVIDWGSSLIFFLIKHSLQISFRLAFIYFYLIRYVSVVFILGGGGLVVSVRAWRAQSPEFESRHGLATFLWKNRRVAKDHPHAAINTILDWDCKVILHRGASAGSMRLSTRNEPLQTGGDRPSNASIKPTVAIGSKHK